MKEFKMIKPRKLFLDKPLTGFEFNQEFEYQSGEPEPRYVLEPVEEKCFYSLNIYESNVEVFLNSGIIREEFPKIWTDKDMKGFKYYVGTGNVEFDFEEFKISKGIEV